MELENLRKEIEKTDGEIMSLLKKRLDLAEEVGLYKIKKGKEIVDPAVESIVIKRYRDLAVSNGMNPDIAEEICRKLIQESVELQKNLTQPK